MEKGHSQNIDPRPKRRMDKDNPYQLFTVGATSKEPHYFIQFKDGEGTEHCFEIEKPLFELFNQFELDDLQRLNEVERHLDMRELSEVPADESEQIRKRSAELEALCKMESEQLHIPHAMRHLSVTLKLLLSGDVKAVQADSGHKDAQMVYNRYSHALDEERKKLAMSLDDRLYCSVAG